MARPGDTPSGGEEEVPLVSVRETCFIVVGVLGQDSRDAAVTVVTIAGRRGGYSS
jgi:hypothetical protein